MTTEDARHGAIDPWARSPAVTHVPLARLRTSFATLRAAKRSRCEEAPLAPMPLRVVPQADGSLEIVDGFYAEFVIMPSPWPPCR